MINTLYLPELREMLAEQNHEALSEFCTALHPAQRPTICRAWNATRSGKCCAMRNHI